MAKPKWLNKTRKVKRIREKMQQKYTDTQIKQEI